MSQGNIKVARPGCGWQTENALTWIRGPAIGPHQLIMVSLMKTPSSKTESQKADGILQMARLRVEIAESRWEETKELAREARRRRKEAKAIARRARGKSPQRPGGNIPFDSRVRPRGTSHTCA